MSPKRRAVPLTDRELDVLTLLVHGVSAGRTARNLKIAPSTVYNLRYSIKCKLNLWSDAELTLWAMGAGIGGTLE